MSPKVKKTRVKSYFIAVAAKNAKFPLSSVVMVASWLNVFILKIYVSKGRQDPEEKNLFKEKIFAPTSLKFFYQLEQL